MNKVMMKLQDKQFVQNLIVEVIGDGLMIILGIVAGYYMKIFIMG